LFFTDEGSIMATVNSDIDLATTIAGALRFSIDVQRDEPALDYLAERLTQAIDKLLDMPSVSNRARSQQVRVALSVLKERLQGDPDVKPKRPNRNADQAHRNSQYQRNHHTRV
jgi:hypothetical protein